MYLRMLAEGIWPWTETRDSADSEDVVDSKDTETDV